MHADSPAAGFRQGGSPDIVRELEILGLQRDDLDPVTIVNAARAKLRRIREADGGERAVSRVVTSLIVEARDQLLERAVCGKPS